MTEEQFWQINPRKYEIYVDGFMKKQQMLEHNMWLMGRYILDAVACVLSDRKHPHHYPEKPYYELEEEHRIIDATNMSEEEKEAGRRAWMRSMGFDFSSM